MENKSFNESVFQNEEKSKYILLVCIKHAPDLGGPDGWYQLSMSHNYVNWCSAM